MADDPDLTGEINQKLVTAKQAWARDGRLLTGQEGRERLPPGQRQVRDWPVLDLGIQPEIPLDRWSLTVDGAVESPLHWRWADFTAQPLVQSVSDIHCVTSWSRYDNDWQGVAARQLLALCRPTARAAHVIFHSSDGYTTNLPLSAFDDDDVMLAHRWAGQPISTEHGGPVRAVVPKLYFWKSAKWLKRIEFSERDKPGFWEVRGYHNFGDPWREQRYS